MRRILVLVTSLLFSLVTVVYLFSLSESPAAAAVSAPIMSRVETAVSSSPPVDRAMARMPAETAVPDTPFQSQSGVDDYMTAAERPFPDQAEVDKNQPPAWLVNRSPQPLPARQTVMPIKAAPVTYAPPPRSAAPPAAHRPLAPAGLYTITLSTVHRSSNSSANSSTFIFTNTGVTTATYDLYFYWPNGDYLAPDGPIQLAAGAAWNYDMDTAGFGQNNFSGRVDVTGDEPLTGAITSSDYGMITGVLYQVDGTTPITDAHVNVHELPNHNWFGGLHVLGDGSYYLGGLPDGDYILHVNAIYPWASQWYDGRLRSDDADTVTISGASTLSGMDMSLQPGGLITGTVYADDGVTPLENINVDLEQGWYGTCTDANGRYTIQGVPYGDQIVRAGGDWNWCLDSNSLYIREYYQETYDFDLATPVAVSGGADIVTGIDFTMEEGGVITGRVTAAAGGAPLADVHVSASEYDTEWYWSSANSDASGYYTITGLVDADYRVRVDDSNNIPPGYARQYYANTPDYNAADRVAVVAPAAVGNIDFALEPGGVITGVIVDAATGLPIPNINVSADSIGSGWGNGDCTAADGSFTISALPYGDYVVRAGGDWNWCQNQPSIYVREYYNEQLFWRQAAPVTVDSGTPTVTDINFTLEMGGYVAGTVYEAASGTPVDGLHVAAMMADTNEWYGGWDTDANGDYLLGPLPGGQYHIYACTGCNGQLLVSEYYSDVYHIQDAELITVTTGVTVTGVNMWLETGVWITGTVTVPGGYSAADIPIDVWQTEPFGFGDGRRTDAGGNYIVPVPPIYDSYWGVAARPWGTDLGAQWAHQFDLSQQTNWDFDLDVGGTIAGRITDGGTPVADLWVNADADEMGQGAQTDASGTYTITNLPPAEYKISAGDYRPPREPNQRMQAFYGGHDWDWNSRIFLESGDLLAGIDFEVPLAGQIEGYVYESDGVTPIEGTRVSAVNGDGFWYGYSQSNGYYTLDVPVGDHKLLFGPEGADEFMWAYYPAGQKWSDAVTATVPPLTSSLSINFTLERRAALSGQVTDAGSGDPLAGIHVVAQNVDPAVDREVAWWNCTDEFGNYSLDRLWPGQYLVTAVGTCGGNEVYGVVTDTFTAVDGGNHTLNLTMTAGTPPDTPFTIRTGESFDYTPLSAGINEDAGQILAALFAPLVQLDDEGNWYSELLVQVPALGNGGAAVINEQLVVTYTLQPGLLWSDGAPLTSDDIRFAWQMMGQPHPFANWWRSNDVASQIERIDTPDAQTAVLTYQPRHFPPGYLGAIPYPMPEHVLGGDHPMDMRWISAYAHNPVGNGPYVVEDWLPGSHLDLRANPNYYKRSAGYPIIEEVRFLFTNDPFWSLVENAADVSVNIWGELPPNYDIFDVDVYTNANLAYDSIIPNLERPFFADVQVRRALYHALDRERFAADNWPDRMVADSWLPPGHPMYSDTLTLYDYNLTTAAAMLDAAGWVDSNGNGIRDKGGVEFEFDLYYNEGNSVRQGLAAIFQADLASIGIDVNIISLPWDELIEAAKRGNLDALMLGWGFGFDGRYDPDGYTIFHSRAIPTAYNSYSWQVGNFSRWVDAANDALMLAARTELDGDTLRSLYAQQLARSTDQVPLWVHSYWVNYNAATPILLNYRPPAAQFTPVTWNMEEWELPANPYDLVVRKQLSANSPAPQPGMVITYAINVNNAGTFTMTHAALLDTLPGAVVYLGAVPLPDAITGTTLLWNLGDLPGGAILPPILVVVQIPSAVADGTVLVNSVEIYADQPDTRPVNNGFVHQVTVRDDVDLAVTKYGVGQPAVGEMFNYYIDFANWGGAPASGAVLTDTLPPEVSFTSANPPPDSNAGGVLTWNLPELVGNQWGGQIEITAEIIDAGNVVNTADIQFGGTDVDLLNNSNGHTENVDAILAPVILRPTQGTTDGTPTVSGLAPSGSVVEIYDIATWVLNSYNVPVVRTFVISTTATTSGTFSVELNLSEGSYIFVATATKAGLTSGDSNATSIVVDFDVPLDTDTVDISANGANISGGSVRAEIRTLAHRTLNVEAVLNCVAAPTAHLEVTENGMFTYNIPAGSITGIGGNDWLVEFAVWLAEPHSTYDIWVEWDCNGTIERELLLFILIDPDGFLYDQSLVDAGTSMTDAIVLNGTVTAFVKLNDTWQVWPANLYGQVNPQTTDATTDDGVVVAGYYSFLTPSGQYRIEATAPGYVPYQSQVLTVITTPVRLDIGLQSIVGGSGVTQAPVDLSTSAKSVDRSTAWIGQELTYDIWLVNDGGGTDVITLTDVIPAYTAYVAGSLGWDSGNADYDAGTDTVWWQGTVANGETVHISYRVVVVGAPAVPFDVVNESMVTGATMDLFSLPGLTAVTTIQADYSIMLPVVLKQ